MKSETFAWLTVPLIQKLKALTAHDIVNCEGSVSQLGSKAHDSPFTLSFLFKWMHDQPGRLALPKKKTKKKKTAYQNECKMGAKRC